MEYILVRNSGDSGFYWRYFVDDKLVSSGEIDLSSYDGGELQLSDDLNLYFDMDKGFYKKDGDNKIYLVMRVNPLVYSELKKMWGKKLIAVDAFVFVNSKEVVFRNGDFEKDILLLDVFFGGEVIVDETFKSGDDSYDFYFRFSSDDLYIDILVKKNGDGVFVFPFLYEFYRAFSKFFYYFNSVNDKFDSISNLVSSQFSSFDEKVSSYYNDLKTSVTEIDTKLDNVNCDFTPVIGKIDEVSGRIESLDSEVKEFDSKLDLVKMAKIPELIDEKISNVFALKSLNGSNGAKFKDGEIVSVKGYSGFWEVVGSYFTLTADNVVTVIYQVKQSDRVMLVPSAYVFKDE